MNYDRQDTKQTFFLVTHTHINIHINLHTDRTKRLTLLCIRTQGKYEILSCLKFPSLQYIHTYIHSHIYIHTYIHTHTFIHIHVRTLLSYTIDIYSPALPWVCTSLPLNSGFVPSRLQQMAVTRCKWR